MELIHSAFFYIIAFISIIAALGVVFSPRIMYSTVALVITFMSIAGLFILLNADFVGLAQVMIYGVGITIIIIFAIMLTGKDEDKRLYISLKPRTLFAFIFSGFILLMITVALTNCFGLSKTLSPFENIYNSSLRSNLLGAFYGTTGTAQVIGENLLKNYILPFEVLSILLLAVIAGTVVLANRDESKLFNPTTIQENDDREEKK